MISKYKAMFGGSHGTKRQRMCSKDSKQRAFNVHRAVQKVVRGHLLLTRAFGGKEQRHENTAWLNRFPGLRIYLYQFNNQDV